MHVLWISDSPDTPSGFGNVTRFVCAGLAARGHRVGILGWQTRQSFDWNACRVHATGQGAMGSDVLYAYLVRHRPDAVIALADVWWLPFFTAPHVRRQLELTQTPWVLYFPIDGDTHEGLLPPSWVELLREVDIPIAMSRYGHEVAGRCGVECRLIPHGVDLETFAPPPDRDAAKAELGLDGKFVVLSDSRNQPRKLLPRLLDVFARFAAQRSDVVLQLHTDPDDEFASSPYYSYDVRADVRHLGLESRVHFTADFAMKQGAGLPLAELARYYQAADVHLLASSGEGFGLPTLQAAAAGAVPMAGDYSASRELVEGHGEAIAIADWGETEFGIRRALIDVDDAVDKLVRLYDDREELRRRSASSREFALAYGWDTIVDSWEDLLRSIGTQRSRTAATPWWGRARVEEEVVEQEMPAFPGMSVTVKMVRRELGRLEMSIAADARTVSDVRLPTVPRACEVAGVRVPRRLGYVCSAPSDALVLVALRRIFPLLSGWTIGPGCPDDLTVVSSEDTRLELAHSVLVLNVAGELPEELLVDAALFGVPCIGTATARAQAALWPELEVDDHWAAVVLARDLLTNPARVKQVADEARDSCVRVYGPSEEEAAEQLRRLQAARTGVAG
jgi:glycosyltransferase involved in cell wall biosynthesis